MLQSGTTENPNESNTHNGAFIPCEHGLNRVSTEHVCCTMVLLHHLVVFWQGFAPMLLAFETELNSMLEIGEPTPVVTVEEEKWIPFDSGLTAYENLTTSMFREIHLLKERVGNHCGFGRLSALIDEDVLTHGSSNPDVIGRDLDKQRESLHQEDFQTCGYYVKAMDRLVRTYFASTVFCPSLLNSDTADGVWICVTSLLSDIRGLLENEVDDGVQEIYSETGINPDYPFNPNDPRSVLTHAHLLLVNPDSMDNE